MQHQRQFFIFCFKLVRCKSISIGITHIIYFSTYNKRTMVAKKSVASTCKPCKRLVVVKITCTDVFMNKISTKPWLMMNWVEDTQSDLYAVSIYGEQDWTIFCQNAHAKQTLKSIPDDAKSFLMQGSVVFCMRDACSQTKVVSEFIKRFGGNNKNRVCEFLEWDSLHSMNKLLPKYIDTANNSTQKKRNSTRNDLLGLYIYDFDTSGLMKDIDE